MHGIQMPRLLASMHGEEMDIGDSMGTPCICMFSVGVRFGCTLFLTSVLDGVGVVSATL
jgi:hypothetical protein